MDNQLFNFKRRVFLGEDASAFKNREEAQDFVDSINGGSKGPFYVKKIAEDLFQVAYRNGSLKEQYFNDIKSFDRIFVMPGIDADGTADVWMGLEKYSVSRDGKRFSSKIRGINGKIVETKTPKQFYRPEVKEAIIHATTRKLDENIKPWLAAGIIGASSLLGTGYREQPYERSVPRTVTVNAERKDDMPNKNTKILDPKRYVEYLIKQENDPLLTALVKHESGFNPSAIGDLKFKDHAYGILQIRKPALIDVNETFGTDYTERHLVPADPNDKEDIEIAVKNSIDVYRKYLKRYKMDTASNEDKAKLWNGGPVTRKFKTDPDVRKKYQTIARNVERYWKSVKPLIAVKS